MRATLTLDEDLVAKLNALANERCMSFEEALNASVRLGIGVAERAARPHRTPAHPRGLPPCSDLEQTLELAGVTPAAAAAAAAAAQNTSD